MTEASDNRGFIWFPTINDLSQERVLLLVYIIGCTYAHHRANMTQYAAAPEEWDTVCITCYEIYVTATLRI